MHFCVANFQLNLIVYLNYHYYCNVVPTLFSFDSYAKFMKFFDTRYVKSMFQNSMKKCGEGETTPMAVLFSGGLDSMILSALLDQCLNPKCKFVYNLIPLLDISLRAIWLPIKEMQCKASVFGLLQVLLQIVNRWIFFLFGRRNVKYFWGYGWPVASNCGGKRGVWLWHFTLASVFKICSNLGKFLNTSKFTLQLF